MFESAIEIILGLIFIFLYCFNPVKKASSRAAFCSNGGDHYR